MYEIYFLSFFSAIRSGFRVILATTLAFGLAGALFNSFITPQFRAEVLLEPPTQKGLKDFILAQIPLNRSDSPEIFDALDTNNIFPQFKMELASRVAQLEFLKSVWNDIASGSPESLKFNVQSVDGFSKKTQIRYFTELTSQWRLNHDQLIHLPQFGIGDPSITFRVESDHTASRPYLILAIEWNDPVLTANLANRYVDFVIDRTNAQVRDLLQAGLEIRAQNISDMMGYQRTNAERSLIDHEQKLERAIEIARELGLEDPTSAFGNFNVVNITPPPQFFVHPKESLSQHSPSQGQKYLPLYHPGNIAKSSSVGNSLTYAPPLYARGWRALELEYQSLKNRLSSDFFIPNIRDLQGQLEWIESINYDEASINSASIAQSAVSTYRTTETKATVLLGLFILIGLVLGIFLALLQHAKNIPLTPLKK